MQHGLCELLMKKKKIHAHLFHFRQQDRKVRHSKPVDWDAAPESIKTNLAALEVIKQPDENGVFFNFFKPSVY